MLTLILEPSNSNRNSNMKAIHSFALTAIVIAVGASNAQAGVIETTLQNATSDTNMCKLVNKPEIGKKIASNFPLNLSKGLTADVYDTNTGLQRPGWFYVVKTKGKVTANILLAYEGSNSPFGPKNLRSWQPALGSCAGFKSQTVYVGTPANTQIKKQLGSFILTQPWGQLTTATPNYKNIFIK
jgi:hypothetical protein